MIPSVTQTQKLQLLIGPLLQYDLKDTIVEFCYELNDVFFYYSEGMTNSV